MVNPLTNVFPDLAMRPTLMLVFLLGFGVIKPSEAQSIDAAVMQGLPYSSVRILAGTESGTGFLLFNQEAIYLVTARHVLANSDGSTRSPQISVRSYLGNGVDVVQHSIEIELARLLREGFATFDSTRDLAAVLLSVRAGDNYYNLEGVTRLDNDSPHGVKAIAIDEAVPFDSVIVTAPVYVAGYPVALTTNPIRRLDVNVPLVRTGVVAGKDYNQGILVVDVPAYGGVSGSPVMAIVADDDRNRVKLYGVITEFVPFIQVWENTTLDGLRQVEVANSGLSIVEPADALVKLAYGLLETYRRDGRDPRTRK
jgi:hypothetical protein